MDIKRRGILVLSYLSIAGGGLVALRLIWALSLGRIANFWMGVGDLLFVPLAIYLVYVGRRGMAYAEGSPLPKSRFGWGRMIFGAIMLFSSANSHFHLYPVRTVIKPLEASNPTQAVAMNVTAIVIAIFCMPLILSGVWVGLRARSESGS